MSDIRGWDILLYATGFYKALFRPGSNEFNISLDILVNSALDNVDRRRGQKSLILKE